MEASKLELAPWYGPARINPQNIDRDNMRFRAWTEALLSNPAVAESLSNKPDVIDIACGFAESAVGMVEGLHKNNIPAHYWGFDKDATYYGYNRPTSTKYIGKTTLPDMDEYIRLYFDKSIDATRSEFYEGLIATCGQPGLLLLRHPDVKKYPEVFNSIIENTLQFSIDQGAPFIITTSNSVSLMRITSGLEVCFGKLGYEGKDEDSESEESVRGLEYSNQTSGRTVDLTFLDSQGFADYSLLEVAGLEEDGISRVLDLYTIFILPK